MDFSNLPDEQLTEEQLGAWGDDWQEPVDIPPPIPAGRYLLKISKIHEDRSNAFEYQGKSHLSVVLDFAVAEGPLANRSAETYAQLNSMPSFFGNRASDIGNLLNAAGLTQPPASLRAMHDTLVRMVASGTSFEGRVEWEGHCSACYERALLAATDALDIEAAKAAASMLGKEEKKRAYNEARKAGKKVSKMTQFPTAPNGNYIPFFACPQCEKEAAFGSEGIVQAKSVVIRRSFHRSTLKESF